jgi:hypothetical protein
MYTGTLVANEEVYLLAEALLLNMSILHDSDIKKLDIELSEAMARITAHFCCSIATAYF